MNKIIVTTLFISFLTIFTACVYDNEQDLIANAEQDNLTCDTCSQTPDDTLCDYEKVDTVSFATHVLPIFENNCFGCHNEENNAAFASGYEFDEYSEIKIFLENGLILPQIRWEPQATQMPYNQAQLSDCDIETIQRWFDQGILNN